MSTTYHGFDRWQFTVSYSAYSSFNITVEINGLTEAQATAYAEALASTVEAQRTATDSSWGTPQYSFQKIEASDDIVYDATVSGGTVTFS